ncbi:DUF6328 family protein [Sinomonas flava]|uniref:DUF6328 family protein n=1 Tax=Sinomonas flava TaxID=496857 RepID=UPI0039A54DF4
MPSETTEYRRQTRYGMYHRRETYAEKLDRNWSEILQELRILQTGLQLLAGFLLTLPFQNRFSSLDAYSVGLYLILVVIATAALLVVLMPLSVHRRLFRRKVKNRLVQSGDWAAKAGLALAALLLTGTTSLMFDVALGRWQSWVVAGCLLVMCLVMLVAVPSVVARTPEPTVRPEDEIIRHGPDDPYGPAQSEASDRADGDPPEDEADAGGPGRREK